MIDYELFCKTKRLKEQEGLTSPQIAEALSLDPRTVRKWLSQDRFRPRKPSVRASKLDPFKNDIVRMLEAHPYTAAQVFQRILERGFDGRYTIWVRTEWQKIDLLVNNTAAMMHRLYPDIFNSSKPFYDIPPNVFRDVVDTNFTGYFLVAREFVPMMIDRGEGRIVNISTSLSTMNMFAPYGPSRAESEALSNIMTNELKQFGIMVNVLLPGGPVDTGGLSINSNQPLPFKLLSPDIVADPIIFLASHLADGITGERIIAKEFHERGRGGKGS